MAQYISVKCKCADVQLHRRCASQFKNMYTSASHNIIS